MSDVLAHLKKAAAGGDELASMAAEEIERHQAALKETYPYVDHGAKMDIRFGERHPFDLRAKIHKMIVDNQQSVAPTEKP